MMKKILKEWKTYLKEEPDHTLSDNEVRANIAKKMETILFAPIKEPREQDRIKSLGGPESIIAKPYSYYVIYGTKEEPIKPSNVYAGMMFVETKVKYFLEKLTNREKDILKVDAHSLLDMSNFNEFPVTGVQTPVEMSGRGDIPKAFEVMKINGNTAEDWAMGGSLEQGAIQDYVFQMIANGLDSTEESPLTKRDLAAIYCLRQEISAYDDDEPGELKNHPAAKMSYEELMAFIKSKQGQ